MRLHEFLDERGKVNEIAVLLRIPPALLSQWKTGARQVPAERCPEIEKATDGAVRCEDLRPDVDWGYLRATDCQVEKLGAGETASVEPEREAA